MPEARTSEWLRNVLCDEIENLRAGRSDHVRAKGVAHLAREVLKSVEVEMLYRAQQKELGPDAKLGALPLYTVEAIEPPKKEEPKPAPDPAAKTTGTVSPVAKTTVKGADVSQFFEGQTVYLASGKKVEIVKIHASGRIEVDMDGATLPYAAKHLSVDPPKVDPVSAPGARFVRGRGYDGSEERR